VEVNQTLADHYEITHEFTYTLGGKRGAHLLAPCRTRTGGGAVLNVLQPSVGASSRCSAPGAGGLSAVVAAALPSLEHRIVVGGESTATD
jgi:Zn-dependent alcohol dehydrogenase